MSLFFPSLFFPGSFREREKVWKMYFGQCNKESTLETMLSTLTWDFARKDGLGVAGVVQTWAQVMWYIE